VAVAILIFIGLINVQAQFHPVQVTTQLVPPYSVYLTDYATPGNDKLRLVMLQRDLTKPSYQIRLQFSLELNGTTVLRTSRSFNPAPINLDAGAPTVITGSDLQPYLDSRNLDFIGISRDEYERTKALPEGSYQICFAAYDYKRQDIAVSASACSFFWLAKDEPPLINFPACGTALPVKNPQQVIFSWLPRNVSSPNSVNQTEYEFSLYEIRPAGRNPNDAVLASNPIYQTTTSTTQLVYGMAEPLLFEKMTYVWRVRAIDKTGRDQFTNNGYSEACTFINGGTTSDIQLETIKDLKAVGEAPRKGKATWTAQQQVDGYKLFYKKKGDSFQWFSQDTKEANVELFDLDSNTDYEVRAQSYSGAVIGPYSDIVKFKTSKIIPPACGDPVLPVNASPKPLAFALKGMTIDVQGIEMTLNEVESIGKGVYAGKGEVSIPYFGGATFHVTFKNLFIDENHTAAMGRVDFVTKKMDAWVDEELAAQKKKHQEENRDTWKGTDFYEKEISYDFPITGVATDTDGNLIITGSDGKTYINKDIPAILINAPGKAIIIEDKNGDQWVVQKDKNTGETKITKVNDGGLSPTMDVVVSDEAKDFVKRALIALGTEYNDAALARLENELQDSRNATQKLIDDEFKKSETVVTEGDDAKDIDLKLTPLYYTEGTKVDLETGIKISQDSKDKIVANGKIEQERNRARILNKLGVKEVTDQTIDLMSHELKSHDKNISEYITQRKKENAADSNILDDVKEAITLLIDKVIEDLPSETKKK